VASKDDAGLTVRLRLGALLSSDDYGSSVERAAKLHPLWQAWRASVMAGEEAALHEVWIGRALEGLVLRQHHLMARCRMVLRDQHALGRAVGRR
jgi:hypothetical protein